MPNPSLEKCDHEYQRGANACSQCGEALTPTPDNSKLWRVLMGVATVIFMGMGVLSLLQLMGDWGNLNGWSNFVALVVGVGLWTRQNWARWMGIVWAAGIFWVTTRQFHKNATLTFVICAVCAGLILILYRYVFMEKPQDQNPSTSSGSNPTH